jgi:hypothetical protein
MLEELPSVSQELPSVSQEFPFRNKKFRARLCLYVVFTKFAHEFLLLIGNRSLHLPHHVFAIRTNSL